MTGDIEPPPTHLTLLLDRIARAVTVLINAPDVLRDSYSKAQVDAVMQAHRQAHAILTEGRDPPSKRGAEPLDD